MWHSWYRTRNRRGDAAGGAVRAAGNRCIHAGILPECAARFFYLRCRLGLRFLISSLRLVPWSHSDGNAAPDLPLSIAVAEEEELDAGTIDDYITDS